MARAREGDPDQLDAMRRRGGETRGAQLRGDASWGRRMAEARRLKRYGPHLTTDQRIDALEQRLALLETSMTDKVARRANGGPPKEVQHGHGQAAPDSGPY